MKTLEIRQKEAATRQANARTPQAQLQYLDGRGFRALRERAKLLKKLATKAVQVPAEKLKAAAATK